MGDMRRGVWWYEERSGDMREECGDMRRECWWYEEGSVGDMRRGVWWYEGRSVVV